MGTDDVTRVEDAAIAHFNEAVFDVIPGDYFVAGGAIRAFWSGETVKDIDLFFATEAGRDAALEYMEAHGALIKEIAEDSEYAHYTRKVELDGVGFDFIHYADCACPAKTIAGFDFTCCAAAITRSGLFLSHKHFRLDATSKRLRAIGDKHRELYPEADNWHRSRLMAKGFRVA